MAQFRSTREQTEQKVVLHMLTEIASNPSIKQRNLAAELGIALGLINTYLKRCITKGWVRISQISPKRITYFVTPEGIKEKSRMVAGYLSNSLTFFRDARSESERIFATCLLQQWHTVALIGEGDLADIARLVANGTGLQVSLATLDDDLSCYDAVLITDILNPQATFDCLRDKVEQYRLLAFNLLHISRFNPVLQESL